MRLDWLAWSNPVAIWWSFLILVSVGNIALLLRLHFRFRRTSLRKRASALATEPLLLLGAAYVIGCAFRSILPRADVQRICLFDTWLSSVFVGRSVATVAELCFIIQWAIVLRALAQAANADTARNIAKTIVAVVALAEACSWYAVITTNYLGNVLENSLWTVAFVLIAIAVLDLLNRYRGAVKFSANRRGGRYRRLRRLHVHRRRADDFARWQADLAAGRQFFGLFSGLHDVATRWVVTHDAARWDGEIIWMSLYFSAAVWTSLLLASFGLVKHLVPRYRLGRRPPKPVARPLAVPVRYRPPAEDVYS